MMFKYVGRTSDGKTKKGTIEGKTRQDVLAKLREQGIRPRELTETKATALNKDISIGGNSVKMDDFVVYCRQFATLIRAGVTIVDSTNILREQTTSKALKAALTEVEADVRGGIPFSEAAMKHPKAFPALFGNMIQSAELTGNIDETLERMADYFEKQHTLRKKIKSALTYPVILTVLIVAVVFFLLLFVIPQFVGIYESMDAELPLITIIIMKASEIVQRFWWLVLLIIGGSVLTFYLIYRSNEKFNYGVHVALLKLPIFGPLMQKAVIARMVRTLASLFESAVPVLESLTIVSRVVENPVIEKVVLEARRNLETGGQLSEPLREHWVFPPIVYQMTEIGEQTGSLDYMLDKVADFYEEDVDRTVDTLQSLIEPLMIVMLAGVVGIIVAAIMVPMLSIYTQM